MEKLTKFAIYFGIAIAAVFLTLILSIMLPHVIENAERDWKRAMGGAISEEELKELFYAEPSYSVFNERYPDAIESFESWSRGEGNLNLIALNYTNLNEVRLNISYDSYQDKIRSNVSCQIHIPGSERELHRGADGQGVSQFIEKVDCLNITLPYEIDNMIFSKSGYSESTPQIVRVN